MRQMGLYRWYMALLLLQAGFVAAAEANQNQADELFHEGYVLYQQHSATKALSKFKEAAKLGHTEAAYYAGNIIRQDYTYITKESENFFLQAAGGGAMYMPCYV